MTNNEKFKTRSIDFDKITFGRIMEFAKKTKRTFKASAEYLIEQSLDSNDENCSN